MEKGRMNKRAFLDTLAEKNGLSVQQVEQAYDMIIGGIVDVVRDGYRLNLMDLVLITSSGIRVSGTVPFDGQADA